MEFSYSKLFDLFSTASFFQAFLECDEAMRKDESLKDEMSGSTAITMLYRKSKLFVGNVGDSRCIACINGLAEPLSSDHKPCNEEEKSRIGNVHFYSKIDVHFVR